MRHYTIIADHGTARLWADDHALTPLGYLVIVQDGKEIAAYAAGHWQAFYMDDTEEQSAIPEAA